MGMGAHGNFPGQGVADAVVLQCYANRLYLIPVIVSFQAASNPM
jgi:hypothetical protein